MVPAWRETDPDSALSDLRTLASQLQSDHPGCRPKMAGLRLAIDQWQIHRHQRLLV